MFKMRKSKKGFTLTELIVVVAILGIIAAVAVPMAAGYIADSKASTDEANAKAIEGAIKRADAIGHIYGDTGTTFSLATLLTGNLATQQDGLYDCVVAELGSMPACEVSGNYFVVNLETGRVTTAGAQGTTVDTAVTPISP